MSETEQRSDAGTRALVMGLGRFGGGLGATRHLLARGMDVTVTDLAPAETLEDSLAALTDVERTAITWRLGEHVPEDFDRTELLVVNQAVPPSNAYVERARAAGARVTTELELFLEAGPATLVLVTGTQGKSSTATLIAGLAEAAGAFRRVHLGGNIGRSLLDALDEMTADDLAVVEVSSYQLEHLTGPAGGAGPAGTEPSVGRGAAVVVITNLLEDHLARHGSLSAYHDAKLRLFELLAPGGRAIVPAEVQADPGSAETVRAPWAGAGPALEGEARTFLARVDLLPPPEQVWTHGAAPADLTLAARGGGQEGDELAFCYADRPLAPCAALALAGTFQRSNALCALGAGLALGLDAGRMADALPGIAGPPHRAQELGRFGAAPWRVVDNGVSTTPDSTLSILAELEAPVALLVGGRSKGQDLTALTAAAAKRCARILCFGEAADELAAALAGAAPTLTTHPTVEAAVTAAFATMAPDETLLFSPACSSFDAYNNFQERAHAFRAALPPA